MHRGKSDIISVNMLDAVWWSMISSCALGIFCPYPSNSSPACCPLLPLPVCCPVPIHLHETRALTC